MKRYSLIIDGRYCGLVSGDDIKVQDIDNRIWIDIMFQGKSIYSMHLSSKYGKYEISDNDCAGADLGINYKLIITT